MAVIAEGRDPNQVPVAECMTNQVITCQASDELEQVADLMAEKQVRRIPVVDRQGAIVGIVALADIAQSRTTGQRSQIPCTIFLNLPRKQTWDLSAKRKLMRISWWHCGHTRNCYQVSSS
jgi:CBS-domain-containing membrane protein